MPAAETLVSVAPATRSEALYRKLSPGPGMDPDEVASHQRARIYAAMIDIVGKEGYNAVTVRLLAQRAGVSTRTFYAHFKGKEECFLCTHAAVVQGAAERIADSQAGAADWLEQMEGAFDAFGREIETRPQTARLALVGAFAAGPAALAQMRSTESLFEAIIGESLGRAPGDFHVPPLLAKGIVGGISCSARSRLLAGKERELPHWAGELLEWTLSFLSETVVELTELNLLARRESASELTGGSEPHPHVDADVPEGERDLILSAVAKLTFAAGHHQLTVPRICAAAGIRRKGFETHFEDATDSFLSMLKLRTSRALEYVIAQATTARTWPESVNRAITALCQQIGRDPVFAKLVFIEAFAAGEEGMLFRDGMLATTTERFRAGIPNEQRPARLTAETSVGAVWGLLHHYVTLGRAQQLPGLIPTLTFLMLTPTIGPSAAAETIRTGLRHKWQYA